MGRRGEISSEQVITITLAVVGFVIILFFLWAAFGNHSDLTEKEACRLSIITRATAPSEAQSSIPLKCTTQKICLSESGSRDACDSVFGGQEYSVVRLSGTDEQKAELIENINANAMYDCWDMTGQGKLDIFGKAFATYRPADTRCIICSRVILGDVSDSVRELVDINGYLATQQVPGSSRTYLQTFVGSSGVQTFARPDASYTEPTENSQTNEIAYIFAQRKSPSGWFDASARGAYEGAFILIGVGATTPLGNFLALTPLGWAIDALTIGGTATIAGVNAERSQIASAAYCGQFSGSLDDPKNRQGCSVVRAVPFNTEIINQMCPHIEGDL